MSFRVGDKIPVIQEVWKENGHGVRGEKIYQAEITEINSKGIRVQLPNGNEVAIPAEKVLLMFKIRETLTDSPGDT